MMSFRNDKINLMTWPNETLRLIGRIQEFKGKQDLFKQQLPEVLNALKDAAVIQSTESSNRLEGIIVETRRLTSIVQKKIQPQTRSEAEVAGYRDVLATIHTSAPYMNLKPGVILQLHRDLMQYTGTGGRFNTELTRPKSPASIGGGCQRAVKSSMDSTNIQWGLNPPLNEVSFKVNDNEITEKLPDGTKRIRFVPVAAWRTPEAMDELMNNFLREHDRGAINEIILIATFILDFLCIHPFEDGNGRMARLLTLLMLYQSGHEVGRYISLEKVVEETKDQYYETLQLSSLGWHQGEHNLLPWINFFLITLLRAYERFAERMGQSSGSLHGRGWKAQKVIGVVNHYVADFTIQDVQEGCPGVSRPTIQRILNQLGQEGIIGCVERGRNARWRKL